MSAGCNMTAWRRTGPVAFMVLLAGVAMLAACHPGSIDDITEADIVLTTYTESADYSKGTYSRNDTLIEIKQNPGDDDSLDHSNDAAIVALVDQNMQALGYTLVESADIDSTDSSTWPDYPLRLAASTASNVLIYSWFYPGYGGWGGWYRPWPGYSTTSFESGTLVFDMGDAANYDPDGPEGQKMPIIWAATMNGVLEGSNINARYTQMINQSFTQSPYLGASQ